jgi:hypothetical protein
MEQASQIGRMIAQGKHVEAAELASDLIQLNDGNLKQALKIAKIHPDSFKRWVERLDLQGITFPNLSSMRGF